MLSTNYLKIFIFHNFTKYDLAMKKISILSIFLFINYFTIYAQKMSVQIIDSKSLKGIPNVAIQISNKKGITTNHLGFVLLNKNSTKTIHISCLGYTAKTVTINDIIKNNYIVALHTKITVLNEISLKKNKTLSVDVILNKVKEQLSKNHPSNGISYKIYGQNTTDFQLKTMNFSIKNYKGKKRAKINSEFQLLSSKIEKNNSPFQLNYFGVFNLKKIPNSKMKDDFYFSQYYQLNAFKTQEKTTLLSIDNIQENATKLILKHLNKHVTYKVKSGFFKVEDSLSLKKINANILKNKNHFSISNVTQDVEKLLKASNFYTNTFELNFLNSKLYKHQLKSNTYFNDEKVYVIHFIPKKSKLKYEGTLYINAKDFAILKVNYSYAKGKKGQHLNLKFLFGVKFSKNYYSAIIKYTKNDDAIYIPSYILIKDKMSFYVNRSFKFTENSADRIKTKFNLKFEGTLSNTSEIIIKQQKEIGKNVFLRKNTKKKYLSAQAYQALLYKNDYLYMLKNERQRYTNE